MSNKIQKVILWVAVIALIIFGGYSISNSKKSADTATANPYMTDGTSASLEGLNPNAQGGKKMAFSQFVKQGGSYKCDVKQYLSDMENTGTVFISGDKITGEYTTIAEGKKINTAFIMSDGYSYTWSSAMPTMGFKMKIPPVSADGTTSADTSSTYSWNADQIGDYNCEPWTLDATKFVPPTNVKFQDMSSMMKP